MARASGSDADRLIEGKRAETKFSTRWASGNYKFQKLRDQDYEIAICLAVSPFDAHCWVIPKQDLLRLWKVEHKIASQHGGRAGSDTAWIDVSAQEPPDWLRDYGGTLSEAVSVLSKITAFKVRRIREDLGEYDAKEDSGTQSGPVQMRLS